MLENSDSSSNNTSISECFRFVESMGKYVNVVLLWEYVGEEGVNSGRYIVWKMVCKIKPCDKLTDQLDENAQEFN